jgi:peptidoglycan/xylan/chitin deacetylase (PgdA/CDA1 family)
MYFFKTPLLIRKLFPSILWQMNTSEKVIYLTFDDGPVPEATPWVLACLEEFNAKATFFMVGENISRYPELYDKVIALGHRAGNHTYNHLKGWQTPLNQYAANFDKAEVLIDNNQQSLFRPPYGQITLAQIRALQKKTKIVMWDVLSADFDKEITPERCLQKSISNTEKGSIVVFHDSVKTITLLKEVLPKYLEHFSSRGFKFDRL